VGPPIDAGRLRTLCHDDRRVIMDVVGLAIAEQLPDDYKGIYAPGSEGLDEAKQVLRAVHAC
jgi:hypothetical protein